MGRGGGYKMGGEGQVKFYSYEKVGGGGGSRHGLSHAEERGAHKVLR